MDMFVCSNCGKEFSNKKKWTDHKRVHDIRIFNCEECGKDINGYTPSRDFRLKKVSTSVSVSKHYQYKKSFMNKYYPDYIMFLLL